MRFIVKQMEKWEHQNGAEHTGDFFEGVLLDNYVLACKRGYAAHYERYVNPWTSAHEIRFEFYEDKKACNDLFDEFYEREREAKERDMYWTSADLECGRYNIDELHELYEVTVDKHEYPDFIGWLWDMERSAVLFRHEG